MTQPHIKGYPLHWPEGWPRTKHPRPSPFSTPMAGARDGLLEELRLLGGRQPVISTNIATYTRGGLEIPYANQGRIEDPGVALYFTLKNEPRVLACDRWNKVEANLQAIRKTIEALRGLERWGSTEMLSRVYQGFAALPPAPPLEDKEWWEVLKVKPDTPLERIEASFRSLIKRHHPDVGGDPEVMRRLVWAMEEARKLAGG